MNKFKKIIASSLFLLLSLFVFSLPGTADARRGCCSWHGGVVNYGGVYMCADGTALSSICAPYYTNYTPIHRETYSITTQSTPAIQTIDYGSCYGIKTNTYDAVKNFDDIYKQEIERSAHCSELKFHAEHVTPHPRLREWLRTTAEYQKVHTKYQSVAGCSIKAKTLDEVSNFNKIYNEMYDRNAFCSELQFHVDRVTPHPRLKSFLAKTNERDKRITDLYLRYKNRNPRKDEIDFFAKTIAPIQRIKSWLQN